MNCPILSPIQVWLSLEHSDTSYLTLQPWNLAMAGTSLVALYFKPSLSPCSFPPPKISCNSKFPNDINFRSCSNSLHSIQNPSFFQWKPKLNSSRIKAAASSSQPQPVCAFQILYFLEVISIVWSICIYNWFILLLRQMMVEINNLGICWNGSGRVLRLLPTTFCH